jgi:hypothetical protein
MTSKRLLRGLLGDTLAPVAPVITHTAQCLAAQARHEQARADFERLYPQACKNSKCLATGLLWSSYDPSPVGISLSPGVMWDAEPCPDCLGKEVCPRCGKPVVEAEATAPNGNHWSVWLCMDGGCGWRDDAQYGGTGDVRRPEAPECECWMTEVQRQWR